MKKGFTLLEIIVAVALFAVVATSAVASLLAINGAQKKAVFMQINQDNIRFALESMAREIRTGTEYRTNCSSNNECFSFINSNQHRIFIQRSMDPAICGGTLGSVGCVVRCDNELVFCNVGASPSPYQPVTAPEVSISSLKFYAAGEDLYPDDNAQARVTIVLVATTPGLSGPFQSTLSLQTTISMLRQEEIL
ncbi:MAG: prepilin-type N-terminal cleavage/methylation domain-containing protein [Candidatus Ryanbacteria bacterium]|nr:prepilin-type N-terminal cleavage/methylation domain-containing protein [Candidatus Ryanbacteria bacterium]